MKTTYRDYTKMNEFMDSIGFMGENGQYSNIGFSVDLTTINDSPSSIIRAMLEQTRKTAFNDGVKSVQNEFKTLLGLD